MLSLHRIKESCVAKSILELLSAEKTIKGLFEIKIFFQAIQTAKYFSQLLVAVQLKRE